MTEDVSAQASAMKTFVSIAKNLVTDIEEKERSVNLARKLVEDGGGKKVTVDCLHPDTAVWNAFRGFVNDSGVAALIADAAVLYAEQELVAAIQRLRAHVQYGAAA